MHLKMAHFTASINFLLIIIITTQNEDRISLNTKKMTGISIILHRRKSTNGLTFFSYLFARFCSIM